MRLLEDTLRFEISRLRFLIPKDIFSEELSKAVGNWVLCPLYLAELVLFSLLLNPKLVIMVIRLFIQIFLVHFSCTILCYTYNDGRWKMLEGTQIEQIDA